MTVFTDNQLMKSEITFFGADGLLDTSDLDLAPHDFYFPTVVRYGDETFLLDKMSGLLHDEQLEPSVTYDGDVTAVNGGVYVLAPDGELSFATSGSEHKEWTMQLPEKNLVQLEVADEPLFVLSECRVTRCA